MTRKGAIQELLDIGYTKEEINTPFGEFLVKNTMEGRDDLSIDEYICLNALFGYDIGFENAMAISTWLWEDEEDYGGSGIETLELQYTDKELIMKCVKEIDVDVTFDKWATEERTTWF